MLKPRIIYLYSINFYIHSILQRAFFTSIFKYNRQFLLISFYTVFLYFHARHDSRKFPMTVSVLGPSETRMFGSSEIWILGQLDELQALESKYPTIQHEQKIYGNSCIIAIFKKEIENCFDAYKFQIPNSNSFSNLSKVFSDRNIYVPKVEKVPVVRHSAIPNSTF
jgi:hypothetical protein